MKAMFKRNFPFIFSILKKVYAYTAFYKNRIRRIEEISSSNLLKQKIFQSKVMKEVFNDNYIIHNGPFEGMRYIDRSSGSALLPKILGSYEESIQDWISHAVESKGYETILDIGCAEGYYAAGFGMRLPNSKIIAYDLDEGARYNSDELIKLNGLHNIEIRSECTHEELNLMSRANTLVFCDIEGYEASLLDPDKAPNLKHADLIVESHDFIVPGITDELIRRFYKTHTIKIIVDYPFRKEKYKTPNKVGVDDLRAIMNENRPIAMKFLYMESINGML